ncbi:O-methyltransferase [Paraburkholderia sp. BR13444]|uniref:O-methyltransferase n=1 Tax=Paraburkholderia sp. BR13444 TaxID=3236997 RepID=UPI0034CF65C8
MPSFRKINYSVRPAKATERRMLGELFRRLYPFERVENYRYIGFGSVYFSDFQIVHRALGIDDMVSIERDTNAKECFEFNKPFRSIDLKFGESEDILPTLQWDKRSIVWLDYDGRLNSSVLSDVATFCANAGSGSVLIVSVNAQPEAEPNEEARSQFERETGDAFDSGAYRLAKLKENLPGRVPPGTQGRSLRKEGVATVFYRVLMNQLAEQIAVRNATLLGEHKLFLQQFAHFHYKDNALMLTVGIILVSEAERSLCEACSFDGLDFVRTGAEAYTIRVPCLTGREIQHLNSQLPAPAGISLECPGVSKSEIQTYSEVYRFFPNFGEILWT